MSALVVKHVQWRLHVRTLAQSLAVAMAAVIPLSNSLTTIVTLLLAISCVVYMDAQTWRRVLKHPVTVAILAFVALNILSSFFSLGSSKDISLSLRKSARLLYFPLLLPLFHDLKWRQFAFIAYLGAVLMSVLAGVFYGWPYFKDTIFTSLFVAFSIFMLLHLSIEYKQYRSISLGLIIFFSWYLFFMNTGRVGQILFLMLFALFLWQRGYLNWKIMAPATLSTGVVIIALLTLPNAFVERQVLAFNEISAYMHNSIQVPPESSMGIRLLLANNTFALIAQKPIIGWGSGSYRQAYTHYAPEGRLQNMERTNPHNQYLLTWVELGLPGLGLLLIIFLGTLKQFIVNKDLEGYLGTGLVLAMMAGCLVNSWLLDFTSAFFFIFFAAIFLSPKYLG